MMNLFMAFYSIKGEDRDRKEILKTKEQNTKFCFHKFSAQTESYFHEKWWELAEQPEGKKSET